MSGSASRGRIRPCRLCGLLVGFRRQRHPCGFCDVDVLCSNCVILDDPSTAGIPWCGECSQKDDLTRQARIENRAVGAGYFVAAIPGGEVPVPPGNKTCYVCEKEYGMFRWKVQCDDCRRLLCDSCVKRARDGVHTGSRAKVSICPPCFDARAIGMLRCPYFEEESRGMAEKVKQRERSRSLPERPKQPLSLPPQRQASTTVAAGGAPEQPLSSSSHGKTPEELNKSTTVGQGAARRSDSPSPVAPPATQEDLHNNATNGGLTGAGGAVSAVSPSWSERMSMRSNSRNLREEEANGEVVGGGGSPLGSRSRERLSVSAQQRHADPSASSSFVNPNPFLNRSSRSSRDGSQQHTQSAAETAPTIESVLAAAAVQESESQAAPTASPRQAYQQRRPRSHTSGPTVPVVSAIPQETSLEAQPGESDADFAKRLASLLNQ